MSEDIAPLLKSVFERALAFLKAAPDKPTGAGEQTPHEVLERNNFLVKTFHNAQAIDTGCAFIAQQLALNKSYQKFTPQELFEEFALALDREDHDGGGFDAAATALDFLSEYLDSAPHSPSLIQ